MQAIQKKNDKGLRENEKKWTPRLLEAGWSMIPNVIVERQKSLGLDAVDINVLLHLIRHWWIADALPFPSKQTIADCMDISPRTVQRRIAAMERKGIVERKERSEKRRGRQSNFYDLTGLVQKSLPLAKEVLDEKKTRKEVEKKRRTDGPPDVQGTS